jgi:ribose/xylose/arabinose/galactoside ABC-type transport system permease subunit
MNVRVWLRRFIGYLLVGPGDLFVGPPRVIRNRRTSSGNYHGFPYNIMTMAVIAIAFVIVLQLSAFGRRIFLVSGNPVMARLVGVNVDRVIIICYLLSGVLAATVGLILCGFVGLVDNFVGRGFELDSIVVAVLGGVALSGGRGTIIGALVGVAILVAITNAVLLFGLPIQFQLIIKGFAIVIAAALNRAESPIDRLLGGMRFSLV